MNRPRHARANVAMPLSPEGLTHFVNLLMEQPGAEYGALAARLRRLAHESSERARVKRIMTARAAHIRNC